LALEFVFTLGILNAFKLTLEVWHSGTILLNLFGNRLSIVETRHGFSLQGI
jgi:hypothetical protein